MLGENIRSKRQLELQSGAYGFITARSKHKDFLAFFSEEVELKRRLSASTHYIWKTAFQHFEKFTKKIAALATYRTPIKLLLLSKF
jgi:hypothetical protein